MDLVRNSCRNYTLTNSTGLPAGWYAEKLENDYQFGDPLANGTLAAGESVTFELGSDGVYNVGYGTFSNIVIVYCDIQEGILNSIAGIMCGTKCSEQIITRKMYYHNAGLLAYNTFLLALNDLHIENFIYTVLEPHVLEQLYCLSDLMKKAKEYLDCANLLDNCNCNGC